MIQFHGSMLCRSMCYCVPRVRENFTYSKLYHNYYVNVLIHAGFAVADSDIADVCTIASKPVKDEIDLGDNQLWEDFEKLNLAPGVNMKKMRK